MNHNDLLGGNILINDNIPEVTIIDYEYAGYNYRAFDFSDHFCGELISILLVFLNGDISFGLTEFGGADGSLSPHFPTREMRYSCLEMYAGRVCGQPQSKDFIRGFDVRLLLLFL